MSRELLDKHGYFLVPIELPPVMRGLVLERDWAGLDRALQAETRAGGVIFEALSRYARFSEIEFIISIRSSKESPDEDGIWHDDGSRLLAFSLSLSPFHEEIGGGRLEIRRREGAQELTGSIATPPYGTLIVFATGQSGFEHKINRVTDGERIIAAGWCSQK
jgi:hypothetical protein